MFLAGRPRHASTVAALALAAVFAAACGQPAGQGEAPRAAASPSAPPPPSMEPSPAARHIPATLVIPSIGVQALIEQVGLDQNDNMAIPRKPMEVGWYSPGPAPGEAGDAVIDGHLDWYGMPRAVFYNLDKLKPGDETDVVAQDGARLRFAVHGLATYPYTAHPAGLFDTTGRPQLSLVTCSGAWDAGKSTYNQRLVVDSTLQGTGTGGWGAADRA